MRNLVIVVAVCVAEMSAASADVGALARQGESQTALESDERSKADGETRPRARGGQQVEQTSGGFRAIEMRGRVFVRNTVERDDWQQRLEIASARLSLRYEHRKRGIRGEVDAEFAEGQGEIRDAYVRLELDRDLLEGIGIGRLRIQAGRFKRPISAVSLTSRWDLPGVERGLLNDLALANEFSGEADEIQLGGRATGIQLEWRNRELPASPRLAVGIFRSAVHEQIADSSRAIAGNRRPLTWREGFPEDIFARLSLRPTGPIRLGVSLGWLRQLGIAGTRSSFRHGWIGGADAVVNWKVDREWRVRLWLEGFVGDNPLHLGSELTAEGTFRAIRTIAALRRRLGKLYLEPHLSAQVFDAGAEAVDAGFSQLSGGMNLGRGNRWRVQGIVDHIWADDAFLGIEGTRFIAQLGALF